MTTVRPDIFIACDTFNGEESRSLAKKLQETLLQEPTLKGSKVIIQYTDDDEAQIIVTNEPTLAKAAKALVDADIKVSLYSGRGYYGAYTVSAGTSKRHSVYESDIRDALPKKIANRLLQDSRGLNKVLYLPQKATELDMKHLVPEFYEAISLEQ